MRHLKVATLRSLIVPRVLPFLFASAEGVSTIGDGCDGKRQLPSFRYGGEMFGRRLPAPSRTFLTFPEGGNAFPAILDKASDCRQ